jgi:hypothetical protein
LMILSCREEILYHYESRKETGKRIEMKKKFHDTDIFPLHHVSWRCSIE